MNKVLVAGGGTAGHIEPALAVADALTERGATVEALGTRRGLETELVPQRGYELRLIDPVPVPRRVSAELFKLPGKLAKAVRQARDILHQGRFDAVVGFGGYVAGPAYLAARALKVPFYVHEANAKAGMANKLGVRLGGVGFNAVADSGMPGEVVGVPVRKDLSGDREGAPAQRGRDTWGLTEDRSTVLVTGGSQGSVRINKALAQALPELTDRGLQVLHAYGKKNEAPDAKEATGHYVAVPYITDMAAAYAVADLVVCRSGAMTVAEVTAAGIPAIYVPLAHGNGEQGLNAAGVIEAGGARLVPDDELTGQRLVAEIGTILDHPDVYEDMRRATVVTGATGAADRIATRVLDDLKNA